MTASLLTFAVKAKASKSKKSRQSALREEFDRQSEEEEAAERRGFSTPGLSDDGEQHAMQAAHLTAIMRHKTHSSESGCLLQALTLRRSSQKARTGGQWRTWRSASSCLCL